MANEFSYIVDEAGNQYEVKDARARTAIAALEGGSFFLGVTTTAIADGSTNPVVSINGTDVTAKNGNMVIYGKKEFVWCGSPTLEWVEFGDLSTLGDLATADTTTATYTPAGTVDCQETTDTVNSITAVGTLPSFTYDANTEKLTFSAGTLPTKGTDVTVVTAVDPTFTGTQANIVAGPTPAPAP